MWSTYREGLVDAESEELFYELLQEKWEDIEFKLFSDWFETYKVSDIVSGMLRPIREEVGSGIPPALFTTNACESMNAVLKR